tara:strand:+ start:1292 stop:2272 length:981 start_codon:yes stop_codon:yes gene_type:complete
MPSTPRDTARFCARIHGLVKRPDLNGKMCIIDRESEGADGGRRFTSTTLGKTLSFRPDNLETVPLCSDPETAAAVASAVATVFEKSSVWSLYRYFINGDRPFSADCADEFVTFLDERRTGLSPVRRAQCQKAYSEGLLERNTVRDAVKEAYEEDPFLKPGANPVQYNFQLSVSISMLSTFHGCGELCAALALRLLMCGFSDFLMMFGWCVEDWTSNHAFLVLLPASTSGVTANTIDGALKVGGIVVDPFLQLIYGSTDIQVRAAHTKVIRSYTGRDDFTVMSFQDMPTVLAQTPRAIAETVLGATKGLTERARRALGRETREKRGE